MRLGRGDRLLPPRGWADARLSRGLVLAALASATAWVHLAQFSRPLEWDSHIFVAVATQILHHGLLPYRDLWELKPPGIFYYLAAVFTVLPEALWSVRFTDYALYLAGAYAFYRLCRSETNRPLALAGATCWLYLSHHETFNLGGVYTEEYAAIAALVAVACAQHAVRSGARRWAFFSGVAVAAAALFKHPGAAALAPALIVMGPRPRVSAYALLLLGVTVPIAAVVAYFWMRGALPEFLDCNVWALLIHGRLNRVDESVVVDRLSALAAESLKMLQPFPVLIGALVIGIPFAVVRPSWLRAAAAAWVIADFIGVAAQRQFAQHHFILTFASTCLLGTLAAAWLLQPRAAEGWYLRGARLSMALLALAAAVPELHRIWVQRWPVVRQEWRVLWSGPDAWRWNPGRDFEVGIGEYVRQRTTATDSVHVQGYGPSLLGAYWGARRRVATRYFYEAPYPIDTVAALAELQRRRPQYVIVASRPPFLYLMPWLAREYSIETVRWHDYGADVWVRTQPESFSAGALTGLTVTPSLGGLTLPAGSVDKGGTFPLALPAPRRGQWTSPVLAARGEQKTYVDWNPRADLAWNRTGSGFPQVEAPSTNQRMASSADQENDARALLGVQTKRGFWTGWPRIGPQPVTIRLGFPAVVDHIDLVPRDARAGDNARCEAPRVASADPAYEMDPGSFTPIEGQWEVMDDGAHRLRFAPRIMSSVRVLSTPDSCGSNGGGMRRVRVRTAGMGTIVRYRTAGGPHLNDLPWQTLADGDELRWPETGSFLQVQYELWSSYADVTPVLRAAHIGRLRFVADFPPA